MVWTSYDKTAVVPVRHQDLLPPPRSEILSRVRKGGQVKARGTARGLNVVLLAAPTLDQLNILIRKKESLDACRPNAGRASGVVRSPWSLEQKDIHFRLLTSQRHHRIDPRSSAGGDITGQERHG